MDEQKYVCPNCNGLVDYGSKFCPHCRYEFGEWGAANNAAGQTSGDEDIFKERNKNRAIIFAAFLLIVAGAVYWFMRDDTEKIVRDAIASGDMTPVFNLYRNASDEDKPQIAYEIADAAFDITIDEVESSDNVKPLKKLYNAVNNPKNANLQIEAGGRDEYMSPFVALVKYAYVQSQLDEMLTQTKNRISSYLPPDKNIDANSLNPREISNLYAWVDEMYNGGYVLYGTRRFFYETLPNYRNCLGILYLPNGADGSALPGYAYNTDVLQIGTTRLEWQNGRSQTVPEYLAVDPEFKDELWKNRSLNEVCKPLDRVKEDLNTMHDNLKQIKEHYKTATPNLNFDGLNFNSTENEFYSKAPLKLVKGEGTIHITNVFANGIAVDFMPYFNNRVQDSVIVTSSFTGSLSNGIKIGDSQNDVATKMQQYYQLESNNKEWLSYLMPNGQVFSFRFYNGQLDEITIREAPGWKN